MKRTKRPAIPENCKQGKAMNKLPKRDIMAARNMPNLAKKQ
jgi:hypothetical protein